tara:strand:- start:14785 stop:15009 length:225 start_codon:yes stop_codon:yes gene_type:complete
MNMSEMKKRLEEMIARLEELEEAKEKVEDLLYYIEEATNCLPDGIMPSHHSEMEWCDTLSQIESEIDEISVRLD